MENMNEMLTAMFAAIKQLSQRVDELSITRASKTQELEETEMLWLEKSEEYEAAINA